MTGPAERLDLRFEGPFGLVGAHDRLLFRDPLAKSRGLYLLAVPYVAGGFLVTYVGETLLTVEGEGKLERTVMFEEPAARPDDAVHIRRTREAESPAFSHDASTASGTAPARSTARRCMDSSAATPWYQAASSSRSQSIGPASSARALGRGGVLRDDPGSEGIREVRDR